MAGSRTLKLSILGDVDNLNKSLKTATTDVETFGDKVGKVGKVVGAAFVAAAAAAGAYAVKIGIDGVKSAIEDEKAQTQLALALTNATGATNAQIAATEQSILQMSLATGVADDNLRPALQRLALSTGDISKAQDLLATALDVSAATGKPLETVANALGKAYDGNTAALGKLGIGLSAAELKTMSFTDVQDQLTTLFGGAAAANAETYSGRIDRMKVAFNEAKETIGFALLPILETVMKFINDNALPVINAFAGAFSDKQSGLSSALSNVVEVVKSYVMPIFEGAVSVFNNVKDAITDNIDSFKNFFEVVKYIAPIIGEVIGGSLKVVGEIASVVITVIAKVLAAIKPLLNTAIDGINLVIRGLNIINPFSDIPYLPRIGDSFATSGAPGAISGGGNGGGVGGSGTRFRNDGNTDDNIDGGTGGGSVGGSVNSNNVKVSNVDPLKLIDNLTSLQGQTQKLTDLYESGKLTQSQLASKLAPLVTRRDNLQNQVDDLLGASGAFFGAESARRGEAAFGGTTINNFTITGAIDKEGTARSVNDLLNNSFYRGTGGAGNLVGVTP
jgi:hypothetical protein